VFVAYDGDTAGISAAKRASELLVRMGVKVRVAALPAGSDPDSFIREHGQQAMKEELERSLDFIDFLIAANPPETPEDREVAARNLLDTVASIEDPIKADLMLEKIAAALSIDRGALTRALETRRSAAARSVERAMDRNAARATGAGSATGRGVGRQAGGGTAGAADSEDVSSRKASPAEMAAQKGLLAVLLAGGGPAQRVREEMAPSDFIDPALRSLAERMLGETGDVDVGALIDTIESPEGRAILTEISIVPFDEDNGERVCDDYIGAIRRSAIEAEIASVDRDIETAELTGDEEKLLARVAARQELARRLAELRAGK